MSGYNLAMQNRIGTMMLCLGIAMENALAQSGGDAASDLRNSLLNQQVFLRNYSAESQVNGRWDGSKVVMDKPIAGLLAAILVKDIRVSSTDLEIDGVRRQMVRANPPNWQMVHAPSNVKIMVHFDGGDPSVILPVVREALFYQSVEDAISPLPPELLIPPPQFDSRHPRAPEPTLPVCDCADETTAACKKGYHQTIGNTPPKLLKQVRPIFSEEALAAGIKTDSMVRLTVDASGMPVSFWIFKSAGYGLDENAARSIERYRFKPATCHGNPISAKLFIDVNFENF